MSNTVSYGHFFGQTINSHASPGIFLSSLVYRAQERHPNHYHERALFCLSLRGIYSEQHGARKIRYIPGSIVFHPSGVEHVTEIEAGGGHVFVIELGHEWIKRLEEYSCAPSTVFDMNHGEMSWHAKRMFDACKADEIVNEMLIEGLVLELLSCLVKRKCKETAPPDWLSKVVELLKGDFQQPHTISYIAEEIGIHPVRLSRVFRRFMNQSIAEYVAKLRIQFASEQLRFTAKDLREIAFEAGFADQSHLTRTFKRFVGTTPAIYRNENGTRKGIHILR